MHISSRSPFCSSVATVEGIVPTRGKLSRRQRLFQPIELAVGVEPRSGQDFALDGSTFNSNHVTAP